MEFSIAGAWFSFGDDDEGQPHILTGQTGPIPHCVTSQELDKLEAWIRHSRAYIGQHGEPSSSSETINGDVAFVADATSQALTLTATASGWLANPGDLVGGSTVPRGSGGGAGGGT